MKKFHFSAKRMIAALLALVCLLGLLPTAAFAVSPGTITLTKCDQTKSRTPLPPWGAAAYTS